MLHRVAWHLGSRGQGKPNLFGFAKLVPTSSSLVDKDYKRLDEKLMIFRLRPILLFPNYDLTTVLRFVYFSDSCGIMTMM